LRTRGLLSGLGMPAVVHDGTLRLRAYAQQSNTAAVVLPKADLETALRQWLGATAADVVFVFGFPYRLPSAVLGVPRYGFINFHDWPMMPAIAVQRLVRACNPQGGGACTIFRGQVLRVHQMAIGPAVATDLQVRPGQSLGLDPETG